MAIRTIIRGDDKRGFCQYAVLDTNGNPLSLAGCLILTTFRTTKTPIESDPFDATALIKHHMQIAGDGSVTLSQGLRLATNAAAGIIIEDLSSAETRLLPVDVPIYNDVQIRDATGVTTTYIMSDHSIATDGYTNRESIA
jgi:hypothetical protein